MCKNRTNFECRPARTVSNELVNRVDSDRDWKWRQLVLHRVLLTHPEIDFGSQPPTRTISERISIIFVSFESNTSRAQWWPIIGWVIRAISIVLQRALFLTSIQEKQRKSKIPFSNCKSAESYRKSNSNTAFKSTVQTANTKGDILSHLIQIFRHHVWLVNTKYEEEPQEAFGSCWKDCLRRALSFHFYEIILSRRFLWHTSSYSADIWDLKYSIKLSSITMPTDVIVIQWSNIITQPKAAAHSSDL